MTQILLRRAGLVLLLFVSFSTAPVMAGPVYLNLVVDPPTTAGAGIPTVPRAFAASPGTFSVSSNKSGPGTFHLYLLDDLIGSYGISFYSIALSGQVSNVFNRSPIGNFDTLDEEGESTGQSGAAGFSDPLLRSGTPNPGVPVQGAQGIGSPFRIGGLGQTASNFNNTPNLPVPLNGSRSWSAVTSGNWGNYATDIDNFVPGKKWLLLGEGNYTGQAPAVNFGASSTVLYYTSPDFNSQGQAPMGPCSPAFCFPPTVQDVDVNNVIANDPGLLTLTMSLVPPPPPLSPPIWSNFRFDSYLPADGASGTGPATPATFDTSSLQFSWNTLGSPLGTYRWLVTAANGYGSDTGSITVRITAVPEPATISLLGFALVAFCNCNRHRR